MKFTDRRARFVTALAVMFSLGSVSAAQPTVLAAAPETELSIPAQIQPASVSANLITNGDFAAGLTGWTPITVPTIYNASAVNGAVRLNPVGAVEQVVTVTPGVVHTLTAYLRINQQFELSGGTFDGATVLVRNAATDAFIASSGTYTIGNSPQGEWTPVFVIFTPAAGVSSIRISFAVVGNVFFGQPISTQMSVDADNFVLSTLPNELSTKPTSAAAPTCTRNGNLLTNGSFSSNINTGWRTLVITDSPFITITTPMSVVNESAQFGPDGWIVQPISTTAGQTYYASIWTKIDAVIDPEPNGFLIMQLRTRTGNVVDQNGVFRDTVGDWARSYFTFTASTAATDVYVLTGGNIKLRGAVDDVAVSECPIPSTRGGGFVGNIRIYLPVTTSGQS